MSQQLEMFGTDHVIQSLKKDTFEKAKMDGCRCPVCDQTVKIYKRSLNSSMAATLIRAYKKHDVLNFFHVTDKDVAVRDGDFAKLRFWGLIQEKSHTAGNEGKRTSGYWCVTPKGRSFVEKDISIPKYIIVYNSRFLDFAGPETYIQGCLGDKFDYNELMKGLDEPRK